MPISRMFSSAPDATSAVEELNRAGYRDEVHLFTKGAGAGVAGMKTAIMKTGFSPERAQAYAERLDAGGALVVVNAPLGGGAVATEILERQRSGDAGAATTEYEGMPFDAATPLSSTFGWKVLSEDPEPLSRFWHWPTLSRRQGPKSSSFGLPLLTGNAAPLSSLIRMKLLSDKAAPLSERVGMKTLSNDAAPLSSWIKMRVLSREAAPLSARLGMKVLTDGDAPLSSRLGLPELTKDEAPLSSKLGLPELTDDQSSHP